MIQLLRKLNPLSLGAQTTEEKPLHDVAILAIFVLIVSFMLGAVPGAIGDGDTTWHLAAGRWIIEHREIPYSDPFSYTVFGQPWVAHEWLSEVVMASTYNVAGLSGVVVLIVAAIALTYLIIGLHLRRWAKPLELFIALAIIAIALVPFRYARPMVLAWPLLAFWVYALLRAREENRAPSLWLAPLMTLWINVHASFAIGLALTLAFALEALVYSEDRRRAFVDWTLFGVVVGLAALINPHGLSGVFFPLYVVGNSAVNEINEFKPANVGSTPTLSLYLLAFIGLSLLRGARLPPMRIVILLGLLYLGLTHQRHQALLLIVGGLVAVPALTSGWISGRSPKPPLLRGMSLKRKASVTAIAVCTFLMVAGSRLLTPIHQEESSINPVRAFRSIPPELMHKRVINEYGLGGPLILRGVPVFVDGRFDVFGSDHMSRYWKIARGDAAEFQAAHTRWQFCWSIFRPQDGIVALLDRLPRWRRQYADEHVVVHVREGC